MKLNTFLRKASIPLNITNILVGLVIGIAHVYLPLAGPFGLALGILTAISCSVSIGISYYFTYKTTDHNQPTEQKKGAQPKQKRPRFWLNVAFLGMAVPMILLNAVAGFFGMYTGIVLLAAGFAMPFTAPIMATAIVLATIFTAGMLINTWLQTDFIWQTLNRPKTSKVKASTTAEKAVQTDNMITPSLLTSDHPIIEATPHTASTLSNEPQANGIKSTTHSSLNNTASLFNKRPRSQSAPCHFCRLPTAHDVPRQFIY